MITTLEQNMITTINQCKIFYNLMNDIIIVIDKHTDATHSFNDVLVDVVWNLTDRDICIWSGAVTEVNPSFLFTVYIFDKLGDIVASVMFVNDVDGVCAIVTQEPEGEQDVELVSVIEEAVQMFNTKRESVINEKY